MGTLSQGLYDYLFKIVVEKAQSAVKKPWVKRELKQALVRTEERFKAITTDEDIYQAVLSCPLHDLPSIADALSKFYDHPGSLSLETALNQRVVEVFHHLSEEKIKESIANYLNILREELITVSSDYRDKQGVLSNIRMEKNTGHIDTQLKNIFSILNNFIETNRIKEEFKEQLLRLQKDLRERRDLTKLKMTIDIAESYLGKLTLPPRVQDQLIEARVYYEEKQRSIRLPWSEMEKLINELKLLNSNIHDHDTRDEEFYKVLRENPETGENVVFTESNPIVAGRLYNEYKQKVSDLVEVIQINVYPLISEFPFLSKSVLSEVILLSDGIQFRSEKHRKYKEALEKDLMIAKQEIDRYKRKVAGL